MSFSIGDRVRVKSDDYFNDSEGEITLFVSGPSGYDYTVEFPRTQDGYQRKFNFFEEELELIDPPPSAENLKIAELKDLLQEAVNALIESSGCIAFCEVCNDDTIRRRHRLHNELTTRIAKAL